MTHAAARAMVLAAGRGERMRPLTDRCPKPLLPVRGRPLMQWSLEALWRGGIREVLVNAAWLGDQISGFFGHEIRPEAPWNKDSLLSNSNQPDIRPLRLRYSPEGQDFGHALETAGGIVRALPQLDEVFWLLAGDVFAPEFTFAAEALDRLHASRYLAHLWLVPNPAHHPAGDFGIGADGRALNLPPGSGQPRYTYSTIAVLRRALFESPP
ncbi:MAG: nucleotidyltransferase family protein, partial [Rhodoferax sp.]|nr:nucleotidyltransferase family protein [Rhodoferax sp.]